MARKIINGWGIIFSLSLLTYISQQIGLYFLIVEYNRFISLLAIFDIVIFIHYCINYSYASGAIKGSNFWLTYTYSITFKVVFIYYFILKDSFALENIERDTHNKMFIFIFLLFTVLMYTLLSFTSYNQLYKNQTSISNEKIFHNDLILHVVIDLFDIFEFLYTLLGFSSIVENRHFWVRLVGGVLLSFSLYLNAYSFPSISLGSEKTFSQDLGDIFFCRKHAAVIGLVLIDVPFFLLRVFLILYFGSKIYFQPFLIKNLCFIPIKCIKINYCNMLYGKAQKQKKIENLSSRLHTKEKHSDKEDDLHIISSPNIIQKQPYTTMYSHGDSLCFHEYPFFQKRSILEYNSILRVSSDQKSKELEPSQQSSRSTTKQFDHGNKDNTKLRNLPKEDLETKHNKQNTSNETTIKERKQKKKKKKKRMNQQNNNNRYNKNNEINSYSDKCRFDKSSQISQNDFFQNLISQQIQTYRKIGPRHMGPFNIIKKMMYINTSHNQNYHIYIDNNFKTSYFNHLRLMIPCLVYYLGNIAMAIIFHLFYRKLLFSELKTLFDDKTTYKLFFEFHNVIYIVCFSIIVGNAAVTFLSYIFLSSFLEVLFITFFVFIKCFANFLFLLCVEFSNIFVIFLRQFYALDDYASYVYLLFAIVPTVKIIRNIYVFLCCLSGRQFIGYLTRPLMKTNNKGKLHTFLNNEFEDDDLNNFDLGYNEDSPLTNHSHLKNFLKRDQKGLISTTSLLIFISIKSMHGLFSFSTLLMGNNIIKNLRLNNNLKSNHYLNIITTISMRSFIILFLYINGKSNRILYNYFKYSYLIIVSVFFLDIILKIYYLVVSQNLRLCVSNRFDLKAMYQDIQHQKKTNKENDFHFLDYLYCKYQTNSFFYQATPIFIDYL